MIIQIIGLPGSGKTALATALSDRINGIHFNADVVRADLNSDLGFTPEDRVEQARRMGALARLTSNQGHITVVDFVCPTYETRQAFGAADILIWVDRITESRFADTNKLWQDPEVFDLLIPEDMSIEEEVNLIIKEFELHDWKAPTTLLLGRYQPWHEGHAALLEKAYERTEQVVIGVRNTHGTSEKDPLPYQEVASRIRAKERAPFVVKFPNITNIVYGRDVGYKIEQVELSQKLQSVSATQKRKELGI